MATACASPSTAKKGADHAVSFYRVVEQAAQALTWLEMEPYTGRTHQLRVHAAQSARPIIGDPKYFEADTNWDFPGGLQNKLHLHARRIVIPHPDAARSTSPRPCRRTWCRRGTCSASVRATRRDTGPQRPRQHRCRLDAVSDPFLGVKRCRG
jgi:23S rRNA-/tRNA-specific pseudouridylate synthase